MGHSVTWMGGRHVGYLSYATVPRVLSVAGQSAFVLYRTDQVRHLLKEPVPMMLGIRFPGTQASYPLHCLFWDGTLAWDPWVKDYHFEDLSAMKVVYAVVAGESRYTGYRYPVGVMETWGTNVESRTPEVEQELAALEATGEAFLRVVES